MKIKRGSTSVRRLIFIADSSSTTGAGLANLAHNSAGLVAYYFAGDLSNEVQITLATATLGTYTSGGFVAVDNTNMPGWYEIGIPDAALDGGNECAIQFRGATNMVPVNIYIELDACDYQVDALGAVKPTTAGRTLTVDTSGNVILQDGSLTATKIATDAITAAKIASDAVAEIQAGLSTLDAAAVRSALGLASANIDTQLAGINAKTTNLPADPADASDIAASFSTVNSTLATIAGYIDTEVAAIKTKTDNLPTDPADASDIAAAFATVNSTLATIAGYLDTEIAAIKAKTDNLPASPASETTLSALSGKLAGITLLKNWLALIMGKAADTTTRAEVNATTAGATFNETTDSLEAIRDRGDAAWVTGSGGSGSGTGARTVTITVNDGTTALQNATVRLTEGANTFTAQTNASGVATFNVDDATYTVAITKAGYSYSGTTLVVNGTEAETYSMTAITITPSTGAQTTGYLTTLDETGQAESGVSIYVSVADVPNDYGLALDEATRTVVSDEDGLVEITGMVKGATYNLRRGLKGRLYPVTIPTSAGSTYELPNMAGV